MRFRRRPRHAPSHRRRRGGAARRWTRPAATARHRLTRRPRPADGITADARSIVAERPAAAGPRPDDGGGRNSELEERLGGSVRQTAVVLGGSAIAACGGYALKLFLARTIGASGIGLFSIGYGAVALVLPFVVWNLDTAALRFVPEFRRSGREEELRRFIWAGVSHLLVTSAVATLAVLLTRRFLAEHVFHKAQMVTVLGLLAWIIPVLALSGFFRQVSRGYKEVARVVAISSIVAFSVRSGVALLLILAGWGLNGLLWAEITSDVAVLVLLYLAARRHLPPVARHPAVVWGHKRRVLAFASTLTARDVLTSLSSRVTILLLGVLLSATDVGIYAIAVSLATAASYALNAFGSVVSPHFVELNDKGTNDMLTSLWFRAARFSMLAGFPVILALGLVPGAFLTLFGSTFRAGSWALAILAVGQIANLASGPSGRLLIMTGYEMTLIWLGGIQAVVTLALIAALVPPLGLAGAAIASSVGTIVFYAFVYDACRRRLGISLADPAATRLAVAAVAMTGLAVLAKAATAGRGLVEGSVAVLGVIAIGWSAIVLRWLLDDEDRRSLRSAWVGALARLRPRAAVRA